MRIFLKTVSSCLLVAALFFGLSAAIEEPASATPTCPPRCTTTVNLTLIGPCEDIVHECLGHIYKPRNGPQCSLSALG